MKCPKCTGKFKVSWTRYVGPSFVKRDRVCESCGFACSSFEFIFEQGEKNNMLAAYNYDALTKVTERLDTVEADLRQTRDLLASVHALLAALTVIPD
jgi:C4-type Zn-finger protein